MSVLYVFYHVGVYKIGQRIKLSEYQKLRLVYENIVWKMRGKTDYLGSCYSWVIVVVVLVVFILIVTLGICYSGSCYRANIHILSYKPQNQIIYVIFTFPV